MKSEWFWVMVIVALPFAAYGLVEFHAQLRSRRDRAIAQRPKYASPRRPGG